MTKRDIVIKKKSNFAPVTFVAAALLLACLAAAPSSASDSVHPAEIKVVTVPGTHPLDASVVDLGTYGYVEQEYYASGTANRYRIKNPTQSATPVDGGHPYKTRFLEFCTFFGRGLKAKMEAQNEGKYLKIGEVRI